MTEKTDAVILCGGLGKRLKAETGDHPKVLVDVDGRPFLDVLIGNLERNGFKRVLLCTGYQAEEVEKRYQARRFALDIEFSREERPLGTGGGLQNARRHVHSDPFIVLNGDSFCPVHYQALLDFHRSRHSQASIVITRVRKAGDYGTISVGKEGLIASFAEKVAGEEVYVNAGVYCLSQDLFDLMPQVEQFSLEKDFFPRLAGGAFYGFETKEQFYDIGTPERLAFAREKLRNIHAPQIKL